MKKINSNTTEKLKSSKDKHARVVAWISIFLVLVSLIVSLKQCSLTEKLAHLNVRPDIKFYIQGSWPNFELKMYNDGPIKAINLTVRKVEIGVERTKVKDKKSPIIIMGEGKKEDSDPRQKIWLYYVEFKPKESTKKIITPEHVGSKWTRIYKIDVEYYRETDMENFRKTILFFAEKDSIYNQTQYKSKDHYSIVMQHYFRYLEKQDEFEKFMHKFDEIVTE